MFDEQHPEWGIGFRATWAPSNAHGWVRTVELFDRAGRGGEFEVVDGLLDVMPAGVGADLEQIRSNLVDAYKRCEVGPWGPLAVYSLEALITDRAEPAEALTATTVWSSGFEDAVIELDPRAVDDAVAGRAARPSHLLTGRPGAYLLRGSVMVPASGTCEWTIVVDTGRSQSEVVEAIRTSARPDALADVAADVAAGTARLAAMLRAADGVQATADRIADAHHLSNVLFNVMRGGTFPHEHRVPAPDLVEFVGSRNREVAARHRDRLAAIDAGVDAAALRQVAVDTDDPDLIRLVLEYLPLAFARRHGDPSRPWNRFSIQVRDDDGGERLSYEGNWRDIFQNWEALLMSYPAYVVNVVAKFVNASTLDGYNAYRISRAGIDWEVPDPDDPWSSEFEFDSYLARLKFEVEINQTKIQPYAKEILEYLRGARKSYFCNRLVRRLTLNSKR